MSVRNPLAKIQNFVSEVNDVIGENPILKTQLPNSISVLLLHKEEQHVRAVLPCHETTAPELLGDFLQCH